MRAREADVGTPGKVTVSPSRSCSQGEFSGKLGAAEAGLFAYFADFDTEWQWGVMDFGGLHLAASDGEGFLHGRFDFVADILVIHGSLLRVLGSTGKGAEILMQSLGQVRDRSVAGDEGEVVDTGGGDQKAVTRVTVAVDRWDDRRLRSDGVRDGEGPGAQIANGLSPPEIG